MNRREAIVVLGSQPDPGTWRFPRHVYDALDLAAQRYAQASIKPVVITSGDQSLSFARGEAAQPFRECDRLADDLVTRGVSGADILREGESRDVISNLYYVKRKLAQYGAPQQIVLPLGDWRIPRIAMVAEKVLGADFMVTYLGVPSDSPDPAQEHLKSDMQGRFLEPMLRGDDAWLSGKFYDSWLYRFWAERG